MYHFPEQLVVMLLLCSLTSAVALFLGSRYFSQVFGVVVDGLPMQHYAHSLVRLLIWNWKPCFGFLGMKEECIPILSWSVVIRLEQCGFTSLLLGIQFVMFRRVSVGLFLAIFLIILCWSPNISAWRTVQNMHHTIAQLHKSFVVKVFKHMLVRNAA